ncbi:MAG: hypothetical protein KA715_00505 [Xanthomonadaceae bacterium]|nr:hypothetical protein [Xanthomonadaceae bacterium]
MAKKKQIILTHDELIQLAKKEHAPYWVYTSPTVAPVGVGPAGSLFSLDPKFLEKTWLFVRVDLSDPSSRKLFEIALEWHRRYSMFPCSVLLIIHPRFEYYLKAKTIEEILDHFSTRIPTVIDHELGFARLTGAKLGAHINIVQKGAIIKTIPIGKVELSEMQAVERELQKSLRLTDPGLSLPFVFEPEDPAFFKTTVSSIDISETEKVKAMGLNLSGKWNIEANRITTQDSTASITFNIPKNSTPLGLMICAEPIDPKSLGAAFILEVNGTAPTDSMLGSEARYDEVQNAICTFKQPGSFIVLKNLVQGRHDTVTMKIPLAGNKPIAIYGFRFFS